ncbi:MAG: FtsX-like permease family protein [Gammaproteobacteria bacterium]|nr:FtsX-like permease family protein [Gammaproteobacteria bacterium]MBU1529369.1 FtsX-like permease family protein [Gammaproteobacteria bacterium]MBU1779252.1 FtsX-like permease family protein [Gammaproteobacteria bacterium]MBU2088152.1 FtsX-like permease family protein [Gammaproteobacteria bacterium]MBU2127671.1 FtsX-like permease family protein [Gammaproteobacteria bacterium]
MQSFQYWIRQSRRSSFRILFVALVLAVAAISSVGVFSARIEAALVRDASQMLGGDLVIESKRNVASSTWLPILDKPEYASLKRAQSVVFPSVVPADSVDLLVSLKAVNNNYPLRGQMTVRDSQGKDERIASGPPKGEFWVDQGVLGSLNVELGDEIQVGEITRPVTRVILVEPDRGGGFVNFAPRVMMNTADLEESKLLGLGSRATWRIYFTGAQPVIDQLIAELAPVLSPVEEIETLENGRPEVSNTLERANDFLAMAALIGTMVACVGIALVAHLFAKEQAGELAVLKSLGYTPKRLLRMWAVGMGMLTLGAGALGVALGWLAHWGLLALLAELVGVDLPLAGLHYLPMGILLSALLLLGFAAVPTWYALRAPAVAVIRHQTLKSSRGQLVLSVLFGVFTAIGVCLLIVKNVVLAMLLFAGFVGTSLVFAVLFWGLLKMLAFVGNGRTRGLANKGTHIAVFQSMSKRASTLVLQGVSLALGLAALLMLAVVQGDLIDRWQEAVPDDAPNRFVFNIQPDQVQGVQDKLNTASLSPVRLYPMVRGRLSAINGENITAGTFSDERARNTVERELNLSFADTLPTHNTIAEGTWFDSTAAKAEVSVEDGVAKTLGIALGDKLTFDIAGTPLTVEITSVRELRWDSMEVNFFMIFPTGVLESFPQTWITSVSLQDDKAIPVSRELVREYPNLTVLDTELVITQLRKILGQVGQAVQFVFLFTVVAGGLVVVACVMTGARVRTREAAIYRAMGASTAQLQRAAWLELSVLGALAGLVAAMAAQGLGWGVAHFVFEFEYFLSPLHIVAGVVAGAVVSVLFGAWSVNKVCRAPVMQTLRQATA